MFLNWICTKFLNRYYDLNSASVPSYTVLPEVKLKGVLVSIFMKKLFS